MIPSKSDIEHWYINATVYKDRVEEVKTANEGSSGPWAADVSEKYA